MGLRNEGLYRTIKNVIPEFTWEQDPQVPSRVVFTHYPTINGRAISLKLAARCCAAIQAGFAPPHYLDTVQEQTSRQKEEEKRKANHRAILQWESSRTSRGMRTGHSEPYFACAVASGRRI